MNSASIFHAVAFKNGDWWVAQCLEYDIATQARTLDALLYELDRILVAHFLVAEEEGLEPFADIPQAPQRFWQMYKRALRTVRPVQKLPIAGDGPGPQVEVAFAEAA